MNKWSNDQMKAENKSQRKGRSMGKRKDTKSSERTADQGGSGQPEAAGATAVMDAPPVGGGMAAAVAQDLHANKDHQADEVESCLVALSSVVFPARGRMMEDVGGAAGKEEGGGYAQVAIDERAASMKARGQMQPIRVYERPRPSDPTTHVDHVVIDGRLRVLAARSLGWGSIRAELVAEPSAAGGQADALAANEHLALDPIEDALGVALLVDKCGGGPDGVKRAAEEMGKSESWVRDRGYLARLTGKARELVRVRRLPLQHAREIAKLADAGARDALADEAARHEDGSGGMEIDLLRAKVKRHVYSLVVVPWRLDVKMSEVKGCVACNACPHNSANEPGLWETGGAPELGDVVGHAGGGDGKSKLVREAAVAVPNGEAAGAGWCTNEKCFGLHREAAEKIVQGAAVKVAKKLRDDCLPASESKVEATGMVPESVNARAVAVSTRALLKQTTPMDGRVAKAEGEEPEGGKAKPKSEAALMSEAQERGREKYQEAISTWHSGLIESVKKASAARPLTVVALALVRRTDEWHRAAHWDKKVRDAYGCPSKLDRLIRMCEKPSLAFIEDQARKTQQTFDVHGNLNDPTRAAALTVLGVDVKPFPEERAFVDAEVAKVLGKQPEQKSGHKVKDPPGRDAKAQSPEKAKPEPKAKAKKGSAAKGAGGAKSTKKKAAKKGGKKK